MVAIKNHEAERFLARPLGAVCVFLVFGADAGLISERARRIVRLSVDDMADPFQLVRMRGDEIASDPLRLIDEAGTIPLFGGRRAIWIEAGAKNIVPALEPVLAAPPEQCMIVIEAGVLKKDSALRKLVERDRRAAAVECYPDSVKDIGLLIDAELRAANLTITPDARTQLTDLLGADRLTSRSELAKLILYRHGQTEVTPADIAAIVADASAGLVDDMIDAAFLGRAEASGAAESAFRANPGAALGQALRHAHMLHAARLRGDMGGDGFARGGFGRQALFQEQIALWSTARVRHAIAILADANFKARRDARLAEAIATRALWAIAQTASRTERSAREPLA